MVKCIEVLVLLAVFCAGGCDAATAAENDPNCVIVPDTDQPCATVAECIESHDGLGTVTGATIHVAGFDFGLCDSASECSELLDAAVEAACDQINFDMEEK